MKTTYEKKKALAKELKIARIRQELTQTELGKLLKKSQSFVNKYETGERRLDVVEFSVICEVLQVKEQDLLDIIK